MSSLNRIGIPHFRGKLVQVRASGYNMDSVVCEILDFPVQHALNIRINTMIGDNNKLSKIVVQDDCPDGFKNIKESGEKNPLNMACVNESHTNDNELSEFGTGFKSAAAAACKELELKTRLSDGSCHTTRFMWEEMSKCKDPVQSYEPSYDSSMDSSAFKRSHPFSTGSTITLRGILNDFYHTTTQEEVTQNIIKNIQKTYQKILKAREDLTIIVNGIKVNCNQNYFDHPLCKPFTNEMSMYIFKENIIYCTIKNHNANESIFIFNTDTKKLNIGKSRKFSNLKSKNTSTTYSLYEDGSVLKARSTTVLLHPEFYPFKDETATVPNNHIAIFRCNRYMGNVVFNGTKDGYQNNTITDISLKSKALSKKIGGKWNKTMDPNSINNDITRALRACVKKLIKNLTSKNLEEIKNKAIDSNLIPRPAEPDAPTEPAEPDEPAEPIAPTEPAEPVAPTEPAEPVAPAEHAEPDAPTEPIAPTEPAEPVAPTEPIAPTEPVAPTEPIAPTEPVEPAEPVAPTEPAEPVAPTEPAESAEPVSPSEPMELTINGHNYNSGSSAFVKGVKDYVMDNLEREDVCNIARKVCKYNFSKFTEKIGINALNKLCDPDWLIGPLEGGTSNETVRWMITEDNLRRIYERILEKDNRLNSEQTLGAGEWKKEIFDKFIRPSTSN